MNASKHRHSDGIIIHGYSNLGKSAYDIARALGLAVNIVDYRLKVNGVKKRSISESLVGKPKSKEHCESISRVRIEKGLAKGDRNPNWNGGTSSEYDKKMAAIKRSPAYKEWRKAVVSVGFCKACKCSSELEAHHILPKSEFPNLIHDVDNGVCLCKACHRKLHSKGLKSTCRELRETLTVNDEGNPQPSSETRRFRDYVLHP